MIYGAKLGSIFTLASQQSPRVAIRREIQFFFLIRKKIYDFTILFLN